LSLPQEKLKPEAQAAATTAVTREYVTGTGFYSARIGQILSSFTDDLEWMVGADTYERMARDPVIAKNIKYQKITVSADGVQLHPAVPEKDPEIDLAREIRDFCQRNLENLHRPLTDIIDEMMNALKRAHTVAEITYNEPKATGVDAYKLTLKSIKCKPRNATAFVVDPFMNEIGLTAWTFGSLGVVSGDKLANGQKVIPREKFCVLRFETEDEDPRGVNELRPGFNFWQGKCLVPALHLKWLEKSGIPSVVGFTSPNAEDEQELDDQGQAVPGGVVKSAEEAMVDSLVQLESGTSAAFKNGATIEVIEVAGTGQQFSRGYEEFDRQLDYFMLLQSGATKDSKYGNRSAKGTLKEVLDLLIWWRKHKVAQMLRFEVLKNLVRHNYGEEKVHLTPLVMLGDSEGKDWATDATAANELGPSLTDSQWLKLLAQIGIAAPEDGEELPSRGQIPASPKQGEADSDASGKPAKDAAGNKEAVAA
jgi:hypothetical protein